MQPPGAGGVDTEALDLARVCYLEATFRHADCAAFFWVATHRAQRRGTSWVDELTAHSVLYRVDNARTLATRALPWGDTDRGEAFNRRWSALRAYAAELVAGQHADACPGAIGWGGTMDSVKPGQRPIKCKAATANWFYASAGVVSAKEASGRD